MIITQKVALKPNKEQEQFFWNCSNASRFIYNFSLDIKAKIYKENGTNLN